MEHPGFFHRAGPFPLWLIAETIGAEMIGTHDGAAMITDVRPLRDAGQTDLAFFENRKYGAHLAATRAGACILASIDTSRAPQNMATLTTPKPYEAFARALTLFYADAMRSKAGGSRRNRVAASCIRARKSPKARRLKQGQ